MNLILFGFKGVGKTSIGRKMSVELCRPFYDTDEMIESLYKKSVREIFRERGEVAFRKIEKEIIHSLKDVTCSVIALGGGTVLDLENLQMLQAMGELLYLKASFETISERVFKTGIPPFVDPENPVTSLKKLYESRSQFFDTIPAQVIQI